MTYQCNIGYRLSAVFTSVCAATAEWTPSPDQHNCIIVTGMITEIISYSFTLFSTAITSLTLHERNNSRTDIDCPMDTISYNCSILSNSERVHLTWSVTLPGSMPVTITYDNTSILNNMNNLAMSVNTMLTTYRRDELVESLIVFTIIRNIVLNETMLECSISGVDSEGAISDLDSEAIKVFVNSTGKQCSQ